MTEVYRCRVKVQASEQMAIEVNGEVISNAEIRAKMADLRLEREQPGAQVNLEERLSLRDEAIDLLIERTLLMQEARRLDLEPAPDAIERAADSLAPRGDGISGCRAAADAGELRRQSERHLTMQALLVNWARTVPAPSGGEIRQHYRDHREAFATPEMVHASHIVKNFDGENRTLQREQVARLRQRIMNGEDFAVIAAAESDCPENSGDLGWFARGTMVEEFDNVVFAAETGVLTEIFETRFGAHIALVHARRPAGIPSFEEVSELIRNRLHRAKLDREVGRRLEALHKRASVREM